MVTDGDINIWLNANHEWLHDCMCHFRKHNLPIKICFLCTTFQVTGKPSSNYGVQNYATSEKENVKYSIHATVSLASGSLSVGISARMYFLAKGYIPLRSNKGTMINNSALVWHCPNKLDENIVALL